MKILNNCESLFEKMKGSWSDKASAILNSAAGGMIELDIVDELLKKMEEKICLKEGRDKLKQRIAALEEKVKWNFSKF